MAMPIPKSQPQDPPEPDIHIAMDNVHLKRLALQGQRAPAVELVRRHSQCKSVTKFLEAVLTAGERKNLTGGQFNVLDDAFEAHWAAANRDTIEIP